MKFDNKMIRSAVVMASVAACSAAFASGPKHPADQEGWYGTLAMGQVLKPSATTTRVDLSGGAVPVTLTGTTTWGSGREGTLAIGRQSWSEDKDKPGEFSYRRIEGELYSGRVDRKAFNVGALNQTLNDRMTATGLFINGLVRVYDTENTRWWVGAGIGWMQVKMPDANTPTTLCGCLGAAKGSGAAFRVKGQVERLLSDKSAVFLELGYTSLPDASTAAGALPRTTYEMPGLVNVSLGLRMKF